MKEWDRILSFSCHLILVILSFLSYCHFPVHPAGSQVTPRSSQSVTPLKLIEDMQPRASSHCELRKVCHLMSCHHGALSQMLVTCTHVGSPNKIGRIAAGSQSCSSIPSPNVITSDSLRVRLFVCFVHLQWVCFALSLCSFLSSKNQKTWDQETKERQQTSTNQKEQDCTPESWILSGFCFLFFGFLDYFLVRCLFEGLAKQHKGQDLTLCHFSQFRVANLFLVAFCLLWVWSFARKHF